MAVKLHVSTLGEHICTIDAQLQWTGRETKDAIMRVVAVPISVQSLVVGDAMLDNHKNLEQLIAATSGEAVPREISVTLIKGQDPRIWKTPQDPMLLATLLSHCDEMPVQMSVGMSAWARHVNFRDPAPQPLLKALPWKAMFGLDPADVVAVFYLDANIDSIEDGSYFLATLVLLESGKMAAAASYLDELDYGYTWVHMLEVTSFRELSALWPNFAKAVGMAPAVVDVDHAQSKASTASDVVRKWERFDPECLTSLQYLDFHFHNGPGVQEETKLDRSWALVEELVHGAYQAAREKADGRAKTV